MAGITFPEIRSWTDAGESYVSSTAGLYRATFHATTQARQGFFLSCGSPERPSSGHVLVNGFGWNSNGKLGKVVGGHG
jgi:hypothetical protein